MGVKKVSYGFEMKIIKKNSSDKVFFVIWGRVAVIHDFVTHSDYLSQFDASDHLCYFSSMTVGLFQSQR